MESESNSSTSSSRKSIADCVGDMYLDEQLADIHFSFPQEKPAQTVPAHKMILVAKSPVFKAMFCGKLAEKGNTIKITDITGKTFRLMLKHVYTDKLHISGDNVGALLHASQKYQLESLTKDCESYLRQNLSLHNACTVLQQAADFALFELANIAHNYLCEHATDIVCSEDFLNLSQDNLQRVLSCDGFSTDEILIFKAALKWAESKLEDETTSVATASSTGNKRRSQGQSKKRRAEPEEEKEKEQKDRRREILGSVLYEIRFADICIEDFNEIVIPSGILTEQEQLFFLKVLSLREDSKQFPTAPEDFNMNNRRESKQITMSEIVRKLPDRDVMDSLPKNLRNCIRIHLHSSKPFKISSLNIVPEKAFGHRSETLSKASLFVQIQGTDYGKKFMLDFTEYSNNYVNIEKRIPADKIIIIEAIITEHDGLITTKVDSNWMELDSLVPTEKEHWVKEELSSSQDIRIACMGIHIVHELILFPG